MVQHGDELADLVHVQSGGRLVEDIHGAGQRTLAELARYLDALGLAAGEGGGGLSQTDVVEPHIFQYGKAAFEYRIIGEELAGLTYGHVQHFRDVQPPIADFEGFVIVALAPAHVAGDVHVGQEVHFHADLTVAAARLAASALDVEAEPPRLVAALAGVRGHGEDVADLVEDLGIGSRVGARRASDGRLIDGHDALDGLHAVDAPDAAWLIHADALRQREVLVQRVHHE